MKPEFKIKGREATPAEYAQLMQALLTSQAATPTARACASDADASATSLIDALFPRSDEGAAQAKDGDRAVYPRVSAFLEGGESISSVSAAPSKAAPGGFE